MVCSALLFYYHSHQIILLWLSRNDFTSQWETSRPERVKLYQLLLFRPNPTFTILLWLTQCDLADVNYQENNWKRWKLMTGCFCKACEQTQPDNEIISPDIIPLADWVCTQANFRIINSTLTFSAASSSMATSSHLPLLDQTVTTFPRIKSPRRLFLIWVPLEVVNRMGIDYLRGLLLRTWFSAGALVGGNTRNGGIHGYPSSRNKILILNRAKVHVEISKGVTQKISLKSIAYIYRYPFFRNKISILNRGKVHVEISKGVPTIQFKSSFQKDVAIGNRTLHLINESKIYIVTSHDIALDFSTFEYHSSGK